MTRNGKIARLPKDIRDELNRRLEDGEEGVRLIEWLNGLPEVQKVLANEFEGRSIGSSNLTEWKNGGFLDWQARQEARALVEEWQAEDDESAPSAELFTSMLMAHYAAALRQSNDAAEEPRERLKRLGKSLREMARLRRCEIGEERLTLMRERLELDRARVKNQPSAEDPEDSEEEERKRHLETAERVKQMLRDLSDCPEPKREP